MPIARRSATVGPPMSRANGTTTAVPSAGRPGAAVKTGERKLAVLLSMAMFVLVVDTSLMNVSISAVVR